MDKEADRYHIVERNSYAIVQEVEDMLSGDSQRINSVIDISLENSADSILDLYSKILGINNGA